MYVKCNNLKRKSHQSAKGHPTPLPHPVSRHLWPHAELPAATHPPPRRCESPLWALRAKPLGELHYSPRGVSLLPQRSFPTPLRGSHEVPSAIEPHPRSRDHHHPHLPSHPKPPCRPSAPAIAQIHHPNHNHWQARQMQVRRSATTTAMLNDSQLSHHPAAERLSAPW